jgi:hypothetical protein
MNFVFLKIEDIKKLNTEILSILTTDFIVSTTIVIITLLYVLYRIHKKSMYFTDFIFYFIPAPIISIIIKKLWIPNMNIWFGSIITIIGILATYRLILKKHKEDMEEDKRIDEDLKAFFSMTDDKKIEHLARKGEEKK